MRPLVGSLNASEERFSCVGRNDYIAALFASNVFLLAMINRVVTTIEVDTDAMMRLVLIGIDC